MQLSETEVRMFVEPCAVLSEGKKCEFCWDQADVVCMFWHSFSWVFRVRVQVQDSEVQQLVAYLAAYYECRCKP